jgi:hypothetical protein
VLPAGRGVFVSGAKHVAVTPAGRGPAATNSLSLNVTLKFAELPFGGVGSFSGWKMTTPSPGRRGSPAPPQRAWSSVAVPTLIGTHGRLHVKPPLVDLETKTPFTSSVRLKLMST